MFAYDERKHRACRSSTASTPCRCATGSAALSRTSTGVRIDSQSPSIFVFYRRFASTLLVSLAPEIINYFDSNVPLDVDLFDGGNNVQVETLPFEGSALQNSLSVNCQLRLYANASPMLVYDSGLQQRTDSIVVYPRFPAVHPRSGEVAVVGLTSTEVPRRW